MSEQQNSAGAMGTFVTVGLVALLVLVSVLYVRVRTERDEARSATGTESSLPADAQNDLEEQLAAARSAREAQQDQAKLVKADLEDAVARLTEERDARVLELEQARARLLVVSGERDGAQRTVVDLEDAKKALETTLIRRERELARVR
jgi:hypothetical protein